MVEERDAALGEHVGVLGVGERRLERFQVVRQRVVVVGFGVHVGGRLHAARAVDGARVAQEDVAVEVRLAALRRGVESGRQLRVLLVGEQMAVVRLLSVLLDGLVLAGRLRVELLPVPIVGAVVEAAHEVAHVVLVLLVGAPVRAVELARNVGVEGVDGALMAAIGQPRPVHALVHGLVELRAGTADGVGVQAVLRVRRFKPLGGGQHVVGQAHAGGGPVHVHVHV